MFIKNISLIPRYTYKGLIYLEVLNVMNSVYKLLEYIPLRTLIGLIWILMINGDAIFIYWR